MSLITRIAEKIPKAWRQISVPAIVVTAVLTWLGTTYTNFSLNNHQAIEGDFAKLSGTSENFFQILAAYSKRATEGTPIDDATQKQFQDTVISLYNEAATIEHREPAVHDEFTKYADALVGLKAAADEMHGQLDAKTFVEATSRYFDADTQFKKKISSRQQSFLKTMF